MSENENGEEVDSLVQCGNCSHICSEDDASQWVTVCGEPGCCEEMIRVCPNCGSEDNISFIE